MKQFVPSKFCLECRGCCRFSQSDSVWAPHFLKREMPFTPKPSKEGGFVCPFLNPEDNRCKIYETRPFECRLYPFLLNKKNGKPFLAVHINCPFIEENINTKEFKEYTKYLAGLLKSAPFKEILKNNPQIIHTYETQKAWSKR